MALRHALLLAVAGLLVLAPVTTAQDDDDDSHTHTVTFDHKVGNGWWVEVYVTGEDVDRVLARDTNGPWVPLKHYPQYGSWGASFRIEPGHQVQFMADDVHGEDILSCWFTHPAGLTPSGGQACSTTVRHGGDDDDDDDGDDGEFHSMAFDHKVGNGWWVEVYVSGGATAVQARDTNGAWVNLNFNQYGAWGGSFRIEPGHDVQFRALAHGDWHESCWFEHPSGVTPTGGQVCVSAHGDEEDDD